MGKKVRSARGSTVDFDLMKIKQQIAANPAPMNVKERERFIDSRVRRRSRRRSKVDPVDLQVETGPITTDDEDVNEDVNGENVDQHEEKTTVDQNGEEETPTTVEESSLDEPEPEKKKVRKVRRKR